MKVDISVTNRVYGSAIEKFSPKFL